MFCLQYKKRLLAADHPIEVNTFLGDNSANTIRKSFFVVGNLDENNELRKTGGINASSINDTEVIKSTPRKKPF